ncbi:MAG: hypothetical protein JO235_20730 [Chroococcidiopsidaceae cyanobacterium CP_BM_RX_35]|nr:hypothetical protein [Chroococcidiopsidaceae cyanobacterium CP_BM_RX_35]
MQLHELGETDLFNELSDQEQEVIAGGLDYQAFFSSLAQYGFTGPDSSGPSSSSYGSYSSGSSSYGSGTSSYGGSTQAGPPQYNGYGPLGLFGPGGIYYTNGYSS